MSVVSCHFPNVLAELNEPERDAWEDHLSRTGDFADLLAFARASLPSAAVPCVCSDASCIRCRIERLCAF